MTHEITTSFFERLLRRRSEMTLEERDFIYEERAKHHPFWSFQNQYIWSCIAAQIGRFEKQNIENMAEAYVVYKQLDPGSNTPVSEIAAVAGIKGLRPIEFFRRTSFNYDGYLSASRFWKAGSVSVGMWKDINHLAGLSGGFGSLRGDERYLEKVEIFSRDKNATEIVFRPKRNAIDQYVELTRQVKGILPLLKPDEVILAQAHYTYGGYPQIARMF